MGIAQMSGHLMTITRWRAIAFLQVLLLLAGCGIQPYKPVTVADQSFLSRALTQESGGIKVTVAVPDAEETLALTGLKLYEQGIQPVWLDIENNSATDARLALWSLDRDYYSPIEVAYMNRRRFSKAGYLAMENWFNENRMLRQIPAGGRTSGLVFTNLKPGTKGFNLDLFSYRQAYHFTFFVPIPGFVPDYATVDFTALYTPDEIVELEGPALRNMLENELPCCATDPEGTREGGPLNLVLVGTPTAVRRSLLRGDWQETSADDPSIAHARTQSFHGRPPDAIFSRRRKDGNERLQLHLWLTPWRTESEPVWVGQAFYWADGFTDKLLWASPEIVRDNTWFLKFAREHVTADLDGAKRYVVQNFWYNQSIRKIGFTDETHPVPMDSPRTTHGGVAYFTSGNRAVIFLSEEPTPLEESQIIYQRSSATMPGGRRP